MFDHPALWEEIGYRVHQGELATGRTLADLIDDLNPARMITDAAASLQCLWTRLGSWQLAPPSLDVSLPPGVPRGTVRDLPGIRARTVVAMPGGISPENRIQGVGSIDQTIGNSDDRRAQHLSVVPQPGLYRT